MVNAPNDDQPNGKTRPTRFHRQARLVVAKQGVWDVKLKPFFDDYKFYCYGKAGKILKEKLLLSNNLNKEC
jgi:hypothetical protein